MSLQFLSSRNGTEDKKMTDDERKLEVPKRLNVEINVEVQRAIQDLYSMWEDVDNLSGIVRRAIVTARDSEQFRLHSRNRVDNILGLDIAR